MRNNSSDLESEIRELHLKIQKQRKSFDEGMRNNMEFEDLKHLFVQIKEMEKRLELCIEEANAQRD